MSLVCLPGILSLRDVRTGNGGGSGTIRLLVHDAASSMVRVILNNNVHILFQTCNISSF